MKILKNTTSTDIDIFSIGRTIPANDEIQIETSDLKRIGHPETINELTSDIISGDIVVNDGMVDILDTDEALAFLLHPDCAESVRFNNQDNLFESQTVQKAIEEAKETSQPLDSTLTSLSNFDSNGILTQTDTDTFVSRTIEATAPISINNGNGVSGNPSISHNNSGVSSGTYGSGIKVPQFSVDEKGHITSVSEVQINQYYISENTGETTTSSGTFSTLGVSLTPPAGTYFVTFNASFTSNTSGTNNVSEFGITKHGTMINQTLKRAGITASGISLASLSVNIPGSTSTIMSVNGSENIVPQWRRVSGSTTHTASHRQLIAIRIA